MLKYKKELENISWTEETINKFLEILKKNGNEHVARMLTQSETDKASHETSDSPM